MPRIAESPRPSSSISRQYDRESTGVPPSSSGRVRPRKPSSPSRPTISRSTSSSRSQRARLGTTSESTKSAAVDRSSSCSSVSASVMRCPYVTPPAKASRCRDPTGARAPERSGGAGAGLDGRGPAGLCRVRPVLDRTLRGLLGMRPRPVVTPRADRPVRVPRADLGGGGRRRHRRGVGGAGAGRAGRSGDVAGGGRAARRPARAPGPARCRTARSSRSSTASTASSGSTTPGGRCCAGSTRSWGSCGRCRATR